MLLGLVHLYTCVTCTYTAHLEDLKGVEAFRTILDEVDARHPKLVDIDGAQSQGCRGQQG